MKVIIKHTIFIIAIFVSVQTYSTTEICENLYRASELGVLDDVKAIVEANVNIASCAGKWGYTPLHGVVTGHGHLTEEDIEIVKYLLKKGANIEAKTDTGITPLHLTPYPEIVEILVQYGANLETTDTTGGTAIHYYAEHPDGIYSLYKALELGANVNHRDNYGKTALDVAEKRNETSKINLLKKYGAK